MSKSIQLNIPTEHQEQAAFVQWFEIQFPTVRIMSIPNGTYTNLKNARKAKKEGLKKGVPDLFIPQWKLWIEMKRVRGGKLSPSQKDWIEHLNAIGYKVMVCKGCSEAVSQIKLFLSSCRS